MSRHRLRARRDLPASASRQIRVRACPCVAQAPSTTVSRRDRPHDQTSCQSGRGRHAHLVFVRCELVPALGATLRRRCTSAEEYGVASAQTYVCAEAAVHVHLPSYRSFLIGIGAGRDGALRLISARIVRTNHVDTPSRQLRGKTGVLPFLADRQRELPLGNRH